MTAKKFKVSPIGNLEFKLAEQLLRKHAFDARLRTLDALQLAAAMSLHQQNPIDYFVASDRVLCEVASLEGFAILNPERS